MKPHIYHLSHIDLDGYSCQLVMQYTPYEITSFNANYGAEVPARIDEILEAIKATKEDALILISDLNLTPDESRMLNRDVESLNQGARSVKIKLLDHHGSGQVSADKYEWYYLDTARCATKIVYEYAKEHFELEDSTWLAKFVDVVNAVDLWHQDEVENFEYGKVCMRLVTETRELSRVVFSTQDRKYKLTLLEQAAMMVNEANAPILLDEKIHKMKKEYYRVDADNTLDNLATAFIVKLFGEKRSDMTIYYKGYRGFLSYGIGNTSIIGNGFLTKYDDDYDFIVDISPRGTMSLRANNKVDVSIIAGEWAKGGGHPNASGGRIQGFKEQFRYSLVKKQIQSLIDRCESVAGKLEFKA